MINRKVFERGLTAIALTVAAGCDGPTGTNLWTEPNPDQTPASIRIEPEAAQLTAIGATLQLSLVALDADGESISDCGTIWSSLSPSVVTVDSMGFITSGAAGAALITAICGGVADTVGVDVSQTVDAVSISPSSASLAVGETVQLVAAAEDANGHPVGEANFSWVSSDSQVAIVSGSGELRGLVGGTVTVTARSGNDSASASVRVNADGTIPQPSSILEQHNFEDGTLGPWATPARDAEGLIVVTGDPAEGGNGQAARFHYFHADAAGRSKNLSIGHRGYPGEPGYLRYGGEIWFRGRLYIPTPPANAVSMNRKLIDYMNVEGPSTRMTLHARGNDLKLSIVRNNREIFAGPTGISLAYDTWHDIEVFVRTNSADAAADGIVQVFMDGSATPVFEKSDAQWILDTAEGAKESRLDIFLIGTQVTLDAGTPGDIDEYRYWDDVVFSTERVR